MNNPYKIRWDLLIMLVSVWNCFSLPVDIAFNPKAFDSAINVIVNHIIDGMFALDILINFRTSIIDDITGHEIVNPTSIAIIYLKSRFIIDLMATVPFDSVFYSLVSQDVSGQLSLLSLLKLFRVLRLTKIIVYLNTSENIKHSLKIFKLLFFLVVYIHC
jgi:Ion transport protein